MNAKEKSDNEFTEELEKLLPEGEIIEWVGSPKPKFGISILESGYYHDVMMGPSSRLGIVLGITIFTSSFFVAKNNIIGTVITILLGFTTIVLPNILQNRRRNKTKYAFTAEKVIFKLAYLTTEKIHILNFNEIAQLKVQFYKDNSGVIYFIPKKPVEFYTKDFQGGKKRFYPTFEMVPEVVELSELIEKFRLKSKNLNS